MTSTSLLFPGHTACHVRRLLHVPWMFAMYLSLLSTPMKIYKYKSAMCFLSKKVISPWLFYLASSTDTVVYISLVPVTVLLGKNSHSIMYFHNTLGLVEKCRILFLQPPSLSHIYSWPNSPSDCGDMNGSQVNKFAFQK